MAEFLFILTTLLAPLALVLFIAILRVKRGVDPFFGPDLIAIQVAVDCSVLADPAVVLPRIWHLAVREHISTVLVLCILLGLAAILLTIKIKSAAAEAKLASDQFAYRSLTIISHAPMAAYIVSHFYVTTYPGSFWHMFD